MRLATVAALILAAGTAHAVPKHDPPKVKTVGKAGAATGFKMTVRLTTDQSPRFTTAFVSLVEPAKSVQLTRGTARHFERGMLLHQFPAETGLVAGQPREVELKVDYATSQLKPGQRVHVVSAWPVENTTDDDNVHVFGAVTKKQGDADEIELPR